MPEERTLSRKRGIMYALAFVFNLSYAIPTYINSTFLTEFSLISEAVVGIIYTASSIATLVAFFHIPAALKRYGNFKVSLGLLAIEAVTLIGLMTSTGPLSIIFFFALNFISIALMNFALDIFLESFSTNVSTGKIRGAFLTATNVAWIMAPAVAPFILMEDQFRNIYAASFLLLIPSVVIIFTKLKGFNDPQYSGLSLGKSVSEIWSNKDIKGILMCQLLLQFFYAWMIIYMPIHLHENIGFDWKTIGGILSFMLIPFILLEAPLGKLADSKFGEKEFLSIGFVIMAICLGFIPFVTNGSAIVWATVLFMSRVGAAMVEVMVDTYFFKQVDASKAHLISFSRMTRPAAYIISPVVATILFTVFDMKGLFMFLGFLMLYGLRYSLALKDTVPASSRGVQSRL